MNASGVILVSLVAGSICFVFYCWTVAATLSLKATAGAAAGEAKAVLNPDAKSISIDDFTKLIEAMGKLTDSLSKASPSLVSLIGAILMFAIAAAASGAFVGTRADNGGAQKPGGAMANSQPPAPGNSSKAS